MIKCFIIVGMSMVNCTIKEIYKYRPMMMSYEPYIIPGNLGLPCLCLVGVTFHIKLENKTNMLYTPLQQLAALWHEIAQS